MNMIKIEDKFLKLIKKQISELNIENVDLLNFVLESQLATDENGEKIDILDDQFLDNILENGYLKVVEKNEESFCLDLTYGLCHQNCLWYIESKHYLNEDLYTGFALNESGEWFVHTYLMDGNVIVDPSKETYIAYFGIKLNIKEIDILKELFPDYRELDY